MRFIDASEQAGCYGPMSHHTGERGAAVPLLWRNLQLTGHGVPPISGVLGHGLVHDPCLQKGVVGHPGHIDVCRRESGDQARQGGRLIRLHLIQRRGEKVDLRTSHNSIWEQREPELD